VETVAGSRAAAPPEPFGWWRALGALLAGSIVAALGVFAILVVAGRLHLLPTDLENAGHGWPWRVDGAWSLLADLGPTLAVALLAAAGIALYVGFRVERPVARWPLALCAVLVGWMPVTQGSRPGLLGVSGGAAFLAMWWATHRVAEMPRPAPPVARRTAAVLATALALALGAVSVSYAALHPVTGRPWDGSVTLVAGRSDRVPVELENRGPLAARVLGISLVDAPFLRIARLERDGPRTSGPTMDSLFSPLGTPRLAAGADTTVALTLAGPSGCSATLRALDVRLAVAGTERTQRVALADPLRVACRARTRR